MSHEAEMGSLFPATLHLIGLTQRRSNVESWLLLCLGGLSTNSPVRPGVRKYHQPIQVKGKKYGALDIGCVPRVWLFVS